MRVGAADLGEEGGEDAEEREVAADVEDEFDGGAVGEGAECGGRHAADAEGEAEEESRDHADVPGEEFGREDEDRAEGGGEDEADDDAEEGGGGEADVRE